MPNLTKIPLSGSTDGRGILVNATAIATGDTIHTATTGATAGLGDDITISAFNSNTIAETLVLGWGGVTDPNDLIEYKIPAGERHTIIDGMFLRNGLIVKAASTTTDLVTLFGHAVRAA